MIKIKQEKIADSGVYQIDPEIKKLAKKAGFVFWGNQEWGPGENHIDWACNYDNEILKFAELLRKKYDDKR